MNVQKSVSPTCAKESDTPMFILSHSIISEICSCTTEITYTELKTYMDKARCIFKLSIYERSRSI